MTTASPIKYILENGKMVKYSDNLDYIMNVSVPSNVQKILGMKTSMLTIDIRQIKNTMHKKGIEFMEGRSNTHIVREGVLWATFLTYIFPWALDAGKVYICFKIVQAFYNDRGGRESSDGRTGFQALIYYGKWYLFLALIPWFVDLVEGVSDLMTNDIKKHGVMPRKG